MSSSLNQYGTLVLKTLKLTRASSLLSKGQALASCVEVTDKIVTLTLFKYMKHLRKIAIRCSQQLAANSLLSQMNTFHFPIPECFRIRTNS